MIEPNLLLGDCLEVMRSLPAESVDAIVTDPPYGLSFMGARWDYDVPSVEIWKEARRLLKPGGYLLAFAGTRTQHRMAVNIEDAGFEIRDMIAWVYGSGFPKSHDVSKAIDRIAPRRELFAPFAEHYKKQRTNSGLTHAAICEAGNFYGKHNHGGASSNWEKGHNVPTVEQWKVLQPLLNLSTEWLPLIERMEAEREVLATTKTNNQHCFGRHMGRESKTIPYDITAPATEAAKQWEGWGTALKPALEPITVARKPFKGTVADNVLKYGTGAINVDACRIDSPDAPEGKSRHGDGIKGNSTSYELPDYTSYMPAGRWPANLLHDGSPEVDDLLQGAARFFYCAKASGEDRDAGLSRAKTSAAEKTNRKEGSAGITPYAGSRTPTRNTHPTVKPVELMRYLCRLVTRPGGVVLDPFMGSGSTGRACIEEGFSFIGIERDAAYYDLACERMRRIQLPLFGSGV